MKDEEKIKNCAIEQIKLPTKICQASCKVCQSNILKEIHYLRKNGAEFKELSEFFEKKTGQSIAPSTFCRHFQNYYKIVDSVTSEILQKDLVDEASKRAVHSSAIVRLIDRHLEIIDQQVLSGWRVNISDLEKLMNIKYRLLSGSDEEEKDLVVTFKNASDKYKVSLAQPKLIPDEPPIIEVSPEGKEED